MKTNPFFHRGPIRDPRYFLGREKETREILALMGKRQNVSVVGPPKIGKTSLLYHLARPETLSAHGLQPNEHLLVYFSFEGLVDFTQKQLFHLILAETVRQGQNRPAFAALAGRFDATAGGEMTFLELSRFLEAMQRAGLQITFLMDEFDLSSANRHLDLNFFSALRSLASQPHIAFVTTSQENLYRLSAANRKVGSPFADLFTTIVLGTLSGEESAELVRRLGAMAGISLESEMDFLLSYSGGHPFYLQLLCADLVECVQVGKTIDENARRCGIARANILVEPLLEYQWARLSSAAQQTMLAAARGETEKIDPQQARELATSFLLIEEAGGWSISCDAVRGFLDLRVKDFGLQLPEIAALEAEVAPPEEARTWLYAAVRALMKTMEAKDRYHRSHSRGVARLAVAIAAHLGLSQEEQEGIRIAARLMDIGKIAISDVILLKPGPLTDIEKEIVRCHPLVAAQILEALEFPWPVKPAVVFHHERWDGSGYPEGLVGEEIPLAARILAAADVFDAITSERPWRPARSRAEALRELVENAGIRYDKRVVRALLAVLPEAWDEGAASGGED